MNDERSNYSALAQLLNAIITRRDMNIIEQFGMTEEHIHDPYFNEIYKNIKKHHEQYGEVPSSDTLLSMGGSCFDYVQNMYQPEYDASDEFLRDKVWEDHMFHVAASLLQTSADYVNADPKAGIEYLKAAISNIESELGTIGTDIVHDTKSRLDVYHQKKGNSSWFYPSGFSKLDEKIGGFAPGEDLIVLFARTGVGKEQPLYSKVLTPDGWTTMGRLKLGDEVITATGDSAPIIGIFPQGYKDVYRVHFSDGTHVDAGLEHLWKVIDRFNPKSGPVVVCTLDLIKYPYRYKIPCVPIVDFHSVYQLQHPYELGYLIGCGVQSRFYISSDQCEVEFDIKKAASYVERMLFNLGIEHNDGTIIIDSKSEMYSDFKMYCNFSHCLADTCEATRLSLLRGICDACGVFNNLRKAVEIKYQNKEQLKITCNLIRSLGGTFKKYGDSNGKIYAYLQVNPFQHISKRTSWKPCKNRNLFLNIKRVEKRNRQEECRCIMVDHPDHTYITNHYTATHNTWIMTKMLHECWKSGYNVGLVEPEMTGVKIGYRFDTINKGYSNKDLVYGRDLSSGPSDYEKYIENLPNETDCKFLVSHPKDFNGSVTVSKLRSWCIRNNIKILGIDGISYMRDERGKSSDSTTITLTNISADLMELSVELGIPILVVVQSNREGTAQGGRLALENIRDSDGISHSASKVLGLYKKNDALHIQILKNRDGDSDAVLAYDWDINLGRFQFIQEGEIEGDNPESDNNSRYSYTTQNSSNNSSSATSPQRPERMSDTHPYQNVTIGQEAPTALF